MKQVLWTEKAPAAIGPYSQGVREGDWIFVSGQIPLDPLTGQIVQGDVAAQSERVLKNIDALLAAAGATFADVVKTTVYLTDLVDFAAVNDVYGRWFEPPYPARATVQVAALPRGALVEIDAIAIARG
jgi:2-iminobutanoate/2-iminopropanoate deaminase